MTIFRLIIASILLCACAYTAFVHDFARLTNPSSADGSLLRSADGHILGSRLIAQSFTSDHYFHPRPSACNYNARAAAGSNLSPLHPKLTARATAIITAAKADVENPIPADLVAASGSGLDPDITEAAARFQAVRVANARKLDPSVVERAIEATKRPLMGEFGGPALVNVLELNLALDAIKR